MFEHCFDSYQILLHQPERESMDPSVDIYVHPGIHAHLTSLRHELFIYLYGCYSRCKISARRWWERIICANMTFKVSQWSMGQV